MRPSVPLRLCGLALACVAVAGLSACGGQAAASGPTWVPQPSVTLEPNPNDGVVPGPTGGATTSPPNGNPTAPSGTPSAGPDPNVVATGLSAPTGVAVLPDGTALVGERTTGRVLQVQPVAGQPVKVIRTLTGLDATGDGGLLDLAVSPTYAQDGLVYAFVTTATDNEVIDFTLTGPATPVLTGIPKGATDNAARLAFDSSGNLLIATSDSGSPALAQTDGSLAGKVLYVNSIGQPVDSTSAVYADGIRRATGLCVDAASGAVVATEPSAGSGSTDQVKLVTRGANLGWPDASTTTVQSFAQVPSAQKGIGDCAVSNKVLYVTSVDHTALLAATLTVTGSTAKLGSWVTSLEGKYGRLLTVVAAPDGTLWLTTTNKDGHGQPVADDERVLHITPSGGGGASKA